MTELVLADAERYQQANDVMKLYVKNQNATQIAKKLNIPRKEVQSHIEEWRTSTQGTKFLQERVEDLLTLMDEHYSELIRESYKTFESVKKAVDLVDPEKSAPLYGQMNIALKAISDLESKRIDVLQKAGLLEAADLGDQFAEQEEKQQLIMDILHEVTAHCDNCKIEVANRLARATGHHPVIVVDEE